MSLKTLQYPAKLMHSEFERRGNKEPWPGNLAAKEICIGSLIERAGLTDRKLDSAALFWHHMDDSRGKGWPAIASYWNALVMELASIPKDVILVELLHYTGSFFELLNSPAAEAKLRRPVPSTGQFMLKEIRDKNEDLAKIYDRFFKELKECQEMRNFLAHNGMFLPRQVVSLDGQEPLFMGFQGSDIFASAKLQASGFTRFEDTELPQILVRGAQWYNKTAEIVDALRAYALDHTDFYKPSVEKRQSENGLWRVLENGWP